MSKRVLTVIGSAASEIRLHFARQRFSVLPVVKALAVFKQMLQKMGLFIKARQRLMRGEMIPKPCGSCLLCTAEQDERRLIISLLR